MDRREVQGAQHLDSSKSSNREDSQNFEVDLIYYDNSPFSDNEERVVFLNRHEEKVSQRMIFFQELCHVIRHSGDQRWMPSLFKEAQEYDADRFALYSALPFFILKSITLPERRGESIGYIAHTFRVPLYFAKKRIEQIEERITQNKLLFALDAAVSTSSELIQPETDRGIFTGSDQAEARIRAHYRCEEDFERPHGLIIEPLLEWLSQCTSESKL